jgi:hypothetical protein
MYLNVTRVHCSACQHNSNQLAAISENAHCPVPTAGAASWTAASDAGCSERCKGGKGWCRWAASCV